MTWLLVLAWVPASLLFAVAFGALARGGRSARPSPPGRAEAGPVLPVWEAGPAGVLLVLPRS